MHPLCDRTPTAEIMKSIHKLDAVALTVGLAEHRLKCGDVGTAVLVHGEGKVFEVEFIRYDGYTVALLTLERSQVRPLRANDIPQVRSLLAA